MKNWKLSKIFLLPLVGSLMAFTIPRAPDCVLEADFFFGITSIERVPGWSDLCSFEAGHEINNPFGNHVDIRSLVSSRYGIGGNPWNPWNWWIEGGWGDGTFCYDDETEQTLGFSCIEGITSAANCPLNIYLQVVGECDDCVNNQLGGTWFKGEFTMDPFLIGTVCGNDENMTRLELMPRTDCNDPSKPWGCGAGEFQD